MDGCVGDTAKGFGHLALPTMAGVIDDGFAERGGDPVDLGLFARVDVSATPQAVDVASALDVGPKTVERWITGRIPYRRHRWAIVDLVGVKECDFATRAQPAPPHRWLRPGRDEPHRWTLPHNVWRHVFRDAEQEIDILAYSGRSSSRTPADQDRK
ncbi:hypothetical protein [Actinoallomurus acaciae]|uniref:Helix-turn-helix domain-containing protein n=1 Tax=Actinoallomurus acaciae TaxID=502577 RepID=A0ABV5YB57_9ACTN